MWSVPNLPIFVAINIAFSPDSWIFPFQFSVLWLLHVAYFNFPLLQSLLLISYRLRPKSEWPLSQNFPHSWKSVGAFWPLNALLLSKARFKLLVLPRVVPPPPPPTPQLHYNTFLAIRFWKEGFLWPRPPPLVTWYQKLTSFTVEALIAK